MIKEKLAKISDFMLKAGLLVYATFAALGVSGQVAGMLICIAGWITGAAVRKNIFWMLDDESAGAVKVIGVFLGVFLISSFFSAYPSKSFDRFRLILGEISFFFAALAVVRSRKFLKTLLLVILFSASFESLYGITQFFTGLNILGSEEVVAFGRVKGLMAHWNKLGSVLALILPLFVALSLQREHRAIYAAASVLSAICLVLTFTRGAWIAASAAILAIGVIKEKRLILVLVFAALAVFLIQPTRDRILRTFTPGLSETLRMEMMKASLKMFADRPLTGQGPNTFQKVFYEKYLPEGSKKYFDDGIRGFSSPHNTYLGMLADTGIPGFGVFIFMIVFFLTKAVNAYKRSADSFNGAVMLGIIGSYAAFLALAMLEYVFSAEPAYFFWLLTGLVFAIKRIDKNEHSAF